MPAKVTTEGKHVDSEKGWTKNRALGAVTPQVTVWGAGLSISQGHKLNPSGEV